MRHDRDVEPPMDPQSRIAHELSQNPFLLSIIALSGGLSATGVAFQQLASDWQASPNLLAALLVLILFAVSAVSYYFLLIGIVPALHRRLPQWLAVLPSLCLLASAVWLIREPPRLPPSPGTPVKTLIVRVAGEKNKAAKNREIWFRGMQLADGTAISAKDFELSKNWWPRGSALLSTGRPVAEASWQGRLDAPVRLNFDRHQHAGIVSIIWDGKVNKHDLYATTASKASIKVDIPNPAPKLAWVFRKGLLASIFVFQAFLLFGAVALLLLGVNWLLPQFASASLWETVILRALCLVLLLGFAMGTGRQSGFYSIPKYWERAWGDDSERLKRWKSPERFRKFFSQHIPEGALVLASASDAATLVMAHNCHVLRKKPTGVAWFNHEEDFADHAELLNPEISWSKRRTLLKKHELHWAYFSKMMVSHHPWVTAIALETHPIQQHVLFRLPAGEALPEQLAGEISE